MTNPLAIIRISGKAVPIEGQDIDTDRIVPARFLKEITFDNMGDYLFYDARHNDDGSQNDFPLNNPIYANASIMVVGRNFGCGSSREHAPQAIKRAGFKAIIGESYSEIFAGNCKALGVPAITASAELIQTLTRAIKANPDQSLAIDLEGLTVRSDHLDINGNICMPESRRQSFLQGTWNALDLLKSNQDLIQKKASELPYVNNAVNSDSDSSR